MTTSEVMTAKFTDSSLGKFWKYFAKGDETRFFDERNLAGNINIDAPCSYNLQWKNGIRDDFGSNRVSCDWSDIRAIESYPGTFVWRFAKKKGCLYKWYILWFPAYRSFPKYCFAVKVCFHSSLNLLMESLFWPLWNLVVLFWKSESRQRRETSLKRTRGFNDVLDNRKKIIISSSPCNVLFMLRLKSIWIIYCHLGGIKKFKSTFRGNKPFRHRDKNVNFNKP